jgi:hypothetical protein
MENYFCQFFYLYLIFALCSLIKSEITSYTGNFVEELEESNFAQFNKTEDNYFIYIYSSSCEECQTVDSIFTSVADLATNLNIATRFVKIKKSKNLISLFKMRRIPAIYYVDNSEAERELFDDLDITFSSLLKFVKRKKNYKLDLLKLNSLEDLSQKNFKAKVLIFTGPENVIDKHRGKIQSIISTAENNDLYHAFFYSNSSEIFQKFNFNPKHLNLFSQVYDWDSHVKGPIEKIEFDLRDDLNDISTIEKILSLYSKKPYGEVTEKEWKTIMNKTEPILILFYGRETKKEEIPKINEFMTEIAMKFRKDLNIYNSTLYNDAVYMMTQALRIKHEKLPILLLTSLDKQKNHIRKYKLEKANLTKSEVEKFINNWKNGKLEPFLQSDDIPVNPVDENGVYKVVGQTFNEFLQQQDKDIVLAICTKIYKNCSKFFERIGRVAKKLSNNAHIAFGTVDPYFNEFMIDFINFNKKVPELLFFPSDRDNLNLKERFHVRIVYDGEYTTKEITDFILINSRTNLKVRKLENEWDIYEEEDKDEIKTIDEDDYSNLDIEEFLRNGMNPQEEYTQEEMDEMVDYYSNMMRDDEKIVTKKTENSNYKKEDL